MHLAIRVDKKSLKQEILHDCTLSCALMTKLRPLCQNTAISGFTNFLSTSSHPQTFETPTPVYEREMDPHIFRLEKHSSKVISPPCIPTSDGDDSAGSTKTNFMFSVFVVCCTLRVQDACCTFCHYSLFSGFKK